MRPDSDIERDVKDELQWRPDLDATDIAVSVKNGVVTLTGFVHSYVDKYEAGGQPQSAWRALSDWPTTSRCDCVTWTRSPTQRSRAKPWPPSRASCPTPGENIKVVVKDGWVHLEGEEECSSSAITAEKAVCRLRGIKGVSNLIKLKPRAQPSEIKRKIQEAFKRNAELDANRIAVEAKGSEVILKGTVRSWAELEEAERVAWSAPGVIKVENRIVVRPQMAAA